MKKRKYIKTRRAEKQDETREKIVEAMVALHEEIGPAQTSIKAIAEKSGVQRLTVYRHFPDETSLILACTSHWFELNPPPKMAEWADIENPGERSRAALLAYYRYYRHTEKMWTGAYRDMEKIEALAGPMGQFEAYLDQVRDDLLASWNANQSNRKSLAITLRHCLRFSTWTSLKKEKLTDKKMADLVTEWFAR